MGKHAVGMTLIELMVTMAIVAIVATVGIPSLASVVKDHRMVTVTNELISALSTARMEAIRSGVKTTLCKSENLQACSTSETTSWKEGWLLWRDLDRNDNLSQGEIVRSYSAQARGIEIHTTVDQVRFLPDGRLKGDIPLVFTLCDDRGVSSARAVLISPTGRVRRGTDIDADGIVEIEQVDDKGKLVTGEVSCS